MQLAVPSTDVKPFVLVSIATVIAAAGAALFVAPSAGAGQLGTSIPSNCVAHASFSGGKDVPGDYRCAGLAIQFHTAGVRHSPFRIWAGQWLFVDDTGQYRVGSCTFNRGVHPTVGSVSHRVRQSFPNDRTGAKGAFLTWKYGDTVDNFTAAAMWAVFHYYAQDSAGSNRAANGSSPLVPSLAGITADSGSADLQTRAQELNDEAVRFAGQWQLSLVLGPDGVATATLLSGATPVPGQPISVLVSGSDLPLAATTEADGTAAVTVPLSPGTVTAVATASAPGPAAVFRGAPAIPNPQGAQLLVTGGEPTRLLATARLDVPPPPTTEVTTTTQETTTTELPTTTQESTTTEASTTTQDTTTTGAATTTQATTTTEGTATIEETSTTEASVVVEVPTSLASEAATTAPATTPPTTSPPPTSLPPTTAARRPPPLPRTGGGGDGGIAYLATALLVGGIGLLGTLRRRDQLAYTRQGDAG